MYSFSNSSSCSSDSEVEGSFNKEIVEFYGIGPYSKDLELSATLEEAAEHEVRIAKELEAEIECQYQARFT